MLTRKHMPIYIFEICTRICRFCCPFDERDSTRTSGSLCRYGVAMINRLLKIKGLFCKTAL